MNDLRRDIAPRRREEGFSLIELVIAVGLIAVLAAIVVVQADAALPVLKGDGAMRVVLGQMRTARDLAVSQRRYMRVTFTAPNQLATLREEVPGPATTAISTVSLEDSVRFMVIDSLGDTPEGFGNGSPFDFDAATNIKFAPDGTLVNEIGQTIDGTAFLAIPNADRSARAITVMGATGRIRAYRWDGANWKPV
jgi:prepilin-type N-terminal cleavage/methylation domain-containing protein